MGLPQDKGSSEEQTGFLLTYTRVLALHGELIQVAVGVPLLNGALDPRLAPVGLRDGKGYVHVQHLAIHLCFAALALDLCGTQKSVSAAPEQGNTFLCYGLVWRPQRTR